MVSKCLFYGVYVVPNACKAHNFSVTAPRACWFYSYELASYNKFIALFMQFTENRQKLRYTLLQFQRRHKSLQRFDTITLTLLYYPLLQILFHTDFRSTVNVKN